MADKVENGDQTRDQKTGMSPEEELKYLRGKIHGLQLSLALVINHFARKQSLRISFHDMLLAISINAQDLGKTRLGIAFRNGASEALKEMSSYIIIDPIE